jgi:hypothetical protein
MMNAYLLRISPQEAETIITDVEAIGQVIKRAWYLLDRHLDLDMAWYGIHFVITSGEVPIPKYEAQKRDISWDDNSLENVLMGGIPTPYEAFFGVVRYLPPEEVILMNGKLEQITEEKFRQLYDPQLLNEEQIPPGSWDAADVNCDWLLGYFQKLVKFYQTAALIGDGILIYML